jgi:glutaminyl-peptide cyclotransferase
MKNNMKAVCMAALVAMFLTNCSTSDNSGKSEQPAKVVDVPVFNADTAYQFVQDQVDFGPRIPNSSEHEAAGDDIIKTLEGYGAKVMVQAFEATAYDGTVLQLRNIIASYNPEVKKRVLLATHWDTRPWASKDPVDKQAKFDGANDGGSGVGVLLEIARNLNTQMPDVGVDLIFFDGEDWGQEQGGSPDTWCLGSQYWSKNPHQKGYSAYYGILLDMVGAKDAQFRYEGTSYQMARKILDKVWKQGVALGYSRYFIPEKSSSITDDHYYVNTIAKIPMIDILQYDRDSGYFGDFHHTQADNMDLIDKNTLKAVGQTVMQVVYYE